MGVRAVAFRVPLASDGEVPRIHLELQRTPKELASRFFQLASGHAIIAPFIKEKFGWIESDLCLWCTVVLRHVHGLDRPRDRIPAQ